METVLKIDQISVFLENRAGRLAEVIGALAEGGVNIKGLSLADTSDFGVLRIIVCGKNRVAEILLEKGFVSGRTAVLAVSLKNECGALNRLLKLVSEANINVEYMYGCASARPDQAVMIFRFDKIDEAVRLLARHNFEIIPESVLCAD